MKPTPRSTAVAFIAVGALLLFLGPFGLLQVPAIAAGVGIYLRLRYAWWVGLAYTVVSILYTAAVVAIALLTGRGGLTFAFLALPALALAAYAYLLLSLAVISRQYRR